MRKILNASKSWRIQWINSKYNEFSRLKVDAMDMKWKIVNDKRAGASWEIGYKEDGNEEKREFSAAFKIEKRMSLRRIRVKMVVEHSR